MEKDTGILKLTSNMFLIMTPVTHLFRLGNVLGCHICK